MALQDIDTVNIAALANPLKSMGYLYNNYVAILPNILPSNWRVPTYNDFETLRVTVPALSLLSTRKFPEYQTGWDIPGNNNSGFSLLGNGIRLSDSSFINLRKYSYLHTQSLRYSYVYVAFGYSTQFAFTDHDPHVGCGIRGLMVDISGWHVGDTVTDYDGNVYETVKIGNQVWMASNWKCTKLNDGTPIALNSGNTYDWSYTTTPQYCTYNNLPLIEE
jgi:uncharacterized protein (TIGR02145 family)